MSGIIWYLYSQIAIIGVPGAPPELRLRAAFRLLLTAFGLFAGLTATGACWAMPARAFAIALSGAVVTGICTVTCWVASVRQDAERRLHEAERRAMARVLAELAGDPDPSQSRLHAV